MDSAPAVRESERIREESTDGVQTSLLDRLQPYTLTAIGGEPLLDRLSEESSPARIAAALRLFGNDPSGDWEPMRIKGDLVGPDPDPGVLVLNGERCYSPAWL
jgi:hypothetical protein